MQQNEYKSQFTALMSKQQLITRHLRASVIDWLFEVGTKLGIDDKSVIFQSINIMDRFYESQTVNLPQNDLQLTAVTALFMASKNLEVDPLDLKTCCTTLCFNKFAKSQFLQKESDLRKATQYENEAPSVLDFLMLYLHLIKLSVQKQIECLKETVQFFNDITTIVYDFSKSIAIDATLFKYKPSVLAASVIFISFQLQFLTLIRHCNLNLSNKHMRELVSQISGVFCHWRFNVLERMLSMREITKIMDFSEHVLRRQATLFEEYRETFPNVYKERTHEYFMLIKSNHPRDRICKTTQSPKQKDEDVEMLEDQDVPNLPIYAQTYDARGQQLNPEIMILQQ